VKFPVLKELRYNFEGPEYGENKYLWFPNYCFIKQGWATFEKVIINYNGKGVSMDTYMLRKLNMSNIPFCEIYMHTL
jgi:hypothetical protein